MTPQEVRATEVAQPGLGLFELPRPLVEGAVRSCRLFNTALDAIFYDVPTLTAALDERDKAGPAFGGRQPSSIVSFDALSDPEGSLLLIDPREPPYAEVFRDVEVFLASDAPRSRAVDVATISGVGSSALGSAALAWDLAVALDRPALAIVPGYGMADVILQSLGGWFGFGLYNYLQTKTMVQDALATAAPATAAIGRNLSASVEGARTVRGGPVFRHGSGSSDVLHALMTRRERPFGILVGHSKGALQIENAIQSLPPDRTRGVRVVTLGCPIQPNVEGMSFHQFLGLFDALGQLNMWGNWPDHWVASWHTTNPQLPPAMDAGRLANRPD